MKKNGKKNDNIVEALSLGSFNIWEGAVIHHDIGLKGHKDDSKKLRYDLLPVCCIEDVVRVLTQGAKKYGDHNWLDVPRPKSRYFAAAMRHLFRWRQGFKKDKETGRSHLTHAICCLIFLLYMEKYDKKARARGQEE